MRVVSDRVMLELDVRFAAPALSLLTALLPALGLVCYLLGAPRYALSLAVLAAACGLGRLLLSALR